LLTQTVGEVRDALTICRPFRSDLRGPRRNWAGRARRTQNAEPIDLSRWAGMIQPELGEPVGSDKPATPRQPLILGDHAVGTKEHEEGVEVTRRRRLVNRSTISTSDISSTLFEKSDDSV
jgi:hypothetical protein